MAKTYDIVIDGKTCTAEHGECLWDVAKRNGIEISALCRSEAFPEHRASCRVCIVEVIARGRSKVVTSCVYPIEGECEVHTDSPRIVQNRKVLMALLAARAPESDLMAAMASHMGGGPGIRAPRAFGRGQVHLVRTVRAGMREHGNGGHLHGQSRRRQGDKHSLWCGERRLRWVFELRKRLSHGQHPVHGGLRDAHHLESHV